MLTYLSWTKGFRSGNYFSRIVTTSTTAAAVANARALLGPTEEETLNSIELGFKSQFLDRRVKLNIAAYQSKYDDIQRTVAIAGSTALQALQNAASATIRGVEIEAVVSVTDALRLEANLSWVDPNYDEFTGLDLTGDGNPDPELARNLSFDRVPEQTAYLAASYDFNSQLSMRLSYAWRDDFFTDVNNTPELAQDAYGLFDASLSYRRDNWSVSLFGRNLNDEEYIDVAIGPGFGNLSWGGAPRTYGIDISYEY